MTHALAAGIFFALLLIWGCYLGRRGVHARTEDFSVMETNWTPEELIAFEDDLAAEFEAGNIAAPLHLSGGNEKQLINIFEKVDKNDWVLCSWRSHYHCLLKGVPSAEVKSACKRGRSIALCFPEYKILSSAIVGGICPIAVGLAWAIKRRGTDEKVHAFLGDMTAMSGIAHECVRYCKGHDLPVHWVVEDNGLSVCTDTRETWGRSLAKIVVDRYEYKMTRPHVGIGAWVKF